jgi:flagellin
MAFSSINTNNSAAIALQSLNSTNNMLETTQKRVSTGFRVADARDDGGAFAVAQRVRGEISGLTSANEQLGAAKGLLDTTLSGLKQISDAITSTKAVLVKLSDPSVTAERRAAYVADYTQLRMQIANFVNDTSYNGVTLLGRSEIPGGGVTAANGANVSVVRNDRGASLAIGATNLIPAALPGGGDHQFDLLAITNGTSAAIVSEYLTGLTSAGAASANRSLVQVEAAVSSTMARYGTAETSIMNQIGFNRDKIDALQSGLGAMIDADLAKESAQLQSLQIRQQLGASALSAANAAPQFLLNLFR